MLFLLTLPMAAQVSRPQIPLTGNIGQGGPSFPLFNSGTIVMSDANYTMSYPDMSAHILRVTSSVSLTNTRSVISPQVFGFEFVVQNATTGGQPITFIGASGTGVSIPNGSAVLVMYDGTNYVSVGSVSGGGGGGINTSPFIIHSPGSVNTLTLNVPDSGDPSLVSSTGTLDINHLFVTDLVGPGVSCLQTDALGNVSRVGAACNTGGGGGGGGTVTSVGLGSPNAAFAISGSPITTSGTFNLDFVPQSTGFVLAGAQNATTLTPAVVQFNTCAVATGTTITCAFTNPTAAGHLIVVGTPRFSTAATDNLSQSYSSTLLSFAPTYYKENSAAGVTSVTVTLSTNPGGAVVIWEISNIVSSNSLDSNSYNVGNISGVNTPIQWAAITSSATNDIFLGYWTCINNSTTAPTAASPYTLGGYQALPSNSWSVGWVWNINANISTDTPVVATANCPAQQWSAAVAFHAAVSPTSAAPSFRPLLASDLPRTPWSTLTDPTPNALTQLNMGTGLTLWYGNVNATGTVNDYGSSLGLIDTSTAPFGSPRDLFFLQGTQSNVRSLDVSSNCGSGGTCAGFYVDGPTGNITMYPNAGIQIPGTGGVTSAASITSDTAMNAPVFNVCTTTNPCTIPARAVAEDIKGRKTPTSSPPGPPPARVSGGEPLASIHLHDFSATLPTDGQVPIYSTSQGKYVPGTITPGGPTGPPPVNPPYTVKPFTTGYTIIASDFANCVTLTYGGTTSASISMPTTLPPAGQCVKIINYGLNFVTINHSGLTVNGSSTASMILPTVSSGSLFTNSAMYISDGTGFVVERTVNSVPWQGIQGGALSNQALTIGGTGSLNPTGAQSVINANQVNGAAVPPSLATVATNASGQLIAGTGAGSLAINGLINATAGNTLSNGNFMQTWNWFLTGSGTNGLRLGESAASTGTGENIVYISTLPGSTANPFSAFARGTANGLVVSATTGNVTAAGSAKFVGPIQTNVLSANSLATNSTGDIIAGTGGGGGGANPPYTIKPFTNGYTILASDFTNCVTLTYSAAASATLNMPTTIPPVGQCIKVINYSINFVIIQHNGLNVNGSTISSLTLPGYVSGSTFPNAVMYISDGTQFVIERYLSSAQWAGIQGGALLNQTLTLGGSSSLSPTGAQSVLNANQVNGAAVPPNLPSVATNSTGQFIAGTGGGGGGVNPPYTVVPLTSGYTFTANDFATCTLFTYATASGITVNLPATVPPAGQCIKILNYSGVVVSVNTNGAPVNGTTTAQALPGISLSPYFTNAAMYVSIGTGYVTERYANSVSWNGIQGGNLSNQALTLGGTSSLSVLSGTNAVIDANEVNGAAVPANLTSVATNASGQLIAGTGGGGSTSWSAITAPTQDTSIALGNWRTVFQPSFAGDNSGGTSYAFQQTGTPGTGTSYTILSSTSTASNVSPLNITNSGGNGFRMDSVSQGGAIRAMGTAKFLGPVQLTGLNNANLLATDSTGNIVAAAPAYTQSIQNISTRGDNTGPITLPCPGFSGGNCPAVTPTVDTTYRVAFTLTLTAAGVGCTSAGSVQIWMGGFTDSDSGYTVPVGTIIAVSGYGGTTYSNSMTMGTGAPTNNTMWNSMPMTINVRAGTTPQWRIQQSLVAPGPCSTQPQFAVHAIFIAGG